MSVAMPALRRGLFAIAVLASTLLGPVDGRAEWLVAHGSGTSIIDFESSVSNVNRGRFAGAGMVAAPGVGQLDSDSWLLAGFSSGDTLPGQNYTNGDFARGVHAGGVATGGLYAFETSPANRTLGAQATGSDFNPGSIQLSVATSIAEQFWTLSFDWWVFNDKPRSSRLEADFSTDGTSFKKISAADLLTPTTADASATWQATTIGPQTLDLGAPADKLWLRWSASDFAGASSRDEFGIDNIAVQVGEPTNASSAPEPSAVVIWLVGLALGLALRRRRRVGIGKDRRVSEGSVGIGGDRRGSEGSEGSVGIGKYRRVSERMVGIGKIGGIGGIAIGKIGGIRSNQRYNPIHSDPADPRSLRYNPIRPIPDPSDTIRSGRSPIPPIPPIPPRFRSSRPSRFLLPFAPVFRFDRIA